MTAVLVAAVLLVPSPGEPGPDLTRLVTYRSACVDHPVCQTPPPPTAPEPTPAPTPEPAPVAAATPPPSAPAPAALGSPAGVERWRELVAAYFPADQVDRALQVMACESGGDPSAVNPSSGASGLMQVMPFWADALALPHDALFDPATNLDVAAWIWGQGGWSHWSCA